VIALTAMTFFAPDVSAQGFERLNSDAIRCLQTGDRGICQRALNNAEVLQRLASNRQAYPVKPCFLGFKPTSFFSSWEMVAVIERSQISRKRVAAVLACEG
jgi:hypothetical protein